MPTSIQSLGMNVPTGKEIYDSIMGGIEPELLTANLPHLDEKYIGETTEQRTARYARYDIAFKAYQAIFTKWVNDLRSSATNFKRAIVSFAEEKNKHEEHAYLNDIEQQLSSVDQPSS